MKQETLRVAMDAFWTALQEGHPEFEKEAPKSRDFELAAVTMYEDWCEANKPRHYYVQRTLIQVVRVSGADTPEEAIAACKELNEPDWFDRALDTEADYLALDEAGKICC